MKPNLRPEVMISVETIAKRVAEMGAEIHRDYEQHELTVVGVLKGSFIFMADLVRAIDLPMKCDFLGLSSYGSATESSGVVAITKDLGDPIEGRDVLVIEDIIDTGLTMAYLLENLRTRRPASVRIASLLSKPARRQVHVDIDYLGFTIEDRFVVGYGLDYDGRHRNLPYIGVMTGG
jgi:hypoxanthine phosphoribosyltransferase